MERKLRVRYLDGNSKYVGIKLQGKWLADIGYKEGDKLSVKAKGKSILIQKEPTDPGGGVDNKKSWLICQHN